MNTCIKNLIYTCLIASSISINAVIPYFNVRSQGENTARELVGSGWNTQINLCTCSCGCECCDLYGNISITPEYTQSSGAYKIAQTLFECFQNVPNNCKEPKGAGDSYYIKISGSQVINRSHFDWLADHFGLPIDFESVVKFKPEIQNLLFDFNLYLGLDQWCNGLFFKIHAPLTYTSWNLHMHESCITGSVNHPLGYFNSNIIEKETSRYSIERNDLVPDFTSFMNGCGQIKSNDINFNPLAYSKIIGCKKTETAIADVHTTLGLNFLCKQNYHIGLGMYSVIPAGTRPCGCYLFEPIVGNGKHWELGGNVTAHWCFWNNNCQKQSLSIFAEANLTHLFEARQYRTFDLRCRPLSRYMLAAKFKNPAENLYAGSNDPLKIPCAQFEETYTPVANLTHLPVDVSIKLQVDASFMVQYIHGNWALDVGYNLWARTCEKLVYPEDDLPCFADDTWALKGDAYMYGFENSSAQSASALSSTQSKASIFSGTNTPCQSGNLPWYKNTSVNNNKLSWSDDSTDIDTQLLTFDENGHSATQVYTSYDPVFIQAQDIALNQASSKGLSHKLFFHIDYTACNYNSWSPYVGIGGEIEFAQENHPYNNENDKDSECYCESQQYCAFQDSCQNAAISQWGIWIKSGFAFG